MKRVAEAALGHELPKRAQVHHVDENRKNDTNGNLVICEDAAYHKLLHRRIRARRATGNVHARQCMHCKRWDDPNEYNDLAVYVLRMRNGGTTTCAAHRTCSAAHMRRQNARAGASR